MSSSETHPPPPPKPRWNIWPVMSVLLAAIGLYIGIRSMPKNDGQIVVLVSYADELLGRLQAVGDDRLAVEWKDRESGANISSLSKLSLTTCVVKNDGELVFDWTSRVTEPITFLVGGEDKVLGVGPPDTKLGRAQRAFSYKISKDRKSVSITTDYLNPGDELRFVVYHTSADPYSLMLSGRIKDQPSIPYRGVPTPAQPEMKALRLWVVGYAASFAMLMLGMVIALSCWADRQTVGGWIIGVGIFVACGIPQGIIVFLAWAPGSSEPWQPVSLAGLQICTMAMASGAMAFICGAGLHHIGLIKRWEQSVRGKAQAAKNLTEKEVATGNGNPGQIDAGS